MTDERYRELLHHELLHERGDVWIDGEGDEWVQVQVEGNRLMLYGRCGVGGGGGCDPQASRRTVTEVSEHYGGLFPCPSMQRFEIAEKP